MKNLDLARAHVASFHGKHVVVVGDLMLDEFVRGDVSRISPEAPVPVVDFRERTTMPGGAGNAAANVVSMGGRASVVGLVGEDFVGEGLRRALAERGIDARGVIAAHGRHTTHKMRVVAQTQQIVRVDVETREPVGEGLEARLQEAISVLLASADAVLLSDYAKGVVSERVARATIAAASARGIPVVVDPKGRDYAKYAGASLITPNVLELEAATGVSTHNADAAIVAAATRLHAVLGGTSVLVTRGARGMTLLEPGSEPFHLPTLARAVFDVTGAGDTVVGTLALALAARVPMRDALWLASQAAGVAVSRVGTVAVTQGDLVAALDA